MTKRVIVGSCEYPDVGVDFLIPDGSAIQVKQASAWAHQLQHNLVSLSDVRTALAADKVELIFFSGHGSSADACQSTWREQSELMGAHSRSWCEPPKEHSPADLWDAAAAYDPQRDGWPGESENVPFGYRGPEGSAITLAPAPKAIGMFPVYSYRTLMPAGLEPDARQAMLRFVGGIMAVLSLLLIRVLAALARLLDIANFVLVMLAACLRYGHREEPGDHNSLPVRTCRSWLGTVPAV